MHKVKFTFLKSTVLVFLILCGSVFMTGALEDTADPDSELYTQIELFSDAINIVESHYVEEIAPKKLVYGAIEGILSSLDGYSHFMDPESFREMEIGTKGEFGGLGIEIGIRDGILTIIAPIDGTPADKAGVEAGDRIVKINGKLTRGIKLTEAVKKLRGKPGTKITLTIIRENTDRLPDFTITRNIIKLKSIKSAKILEDGIAYIKLVEFQQNTSTELEEKVAGLKKEGMRALILDLRNNPGGLLDMAYEISDKFLPKDKVVVTLKGRKAGQNKVYKASGKGKFTDFPMIILVNKGSASASEIVAGAIKDNERGIILGEKTFGKGSVQTVIPLKDGSAVRLTTAAYHVPSGQSIKGEGITPDVEVKLAKKKETKEKEDIFKKLEETNGKEKLKKKEEKPTRDNQVQAAIDMLRGILLYREKG